MSCSCCGGSSSAGGIGEDDARFAELESYIRELNPNAVPERRRGFLIQILHRAQNIFGYLPEVVQNFVARQLKISRAEVYGVISFYSYFTDTPIGRYKINVCTGTACFVKGAPKVLEEFRRRLGIQEGENTPDGKFFLGILRCVGACSLAPVVMVNDRVYGNMTAERVPDVLADCTD